MILDLENLDFKYNLDIKGVIHIGAHHGEEDQCYKKLGIQNKVFIEPISSNFFTMFDKLAEDDDENVTSFNIFFTILFCSPSSPVPIIFVVIFIYFSKSFDSALL